MKTRKLIYVFGERCSLIPQRYLLTFMCFLGVVVAYILRTCVNLAVTKMLSRHERCPDGVIIKNQTFPYECTDGQIDWSGTMKQQILASFYYGYLVAHLPGAYITRKIGGKYTFGIGILASSLFSILSPLAACHSPTAFMVVRIAMGLAEGPTFPALSELLTQWTPTNERTFLSTIVFAGVQIGTVVSMIITGYMLEHLPWSDVYYVLGVSGVIWFVFWSLLCYENPSVHPFISDVELQYLKEEVPESQKDTPTPWKAMLCSMPLWSLTIAQMGHDYGLYTMVTELPSYYYDITEFTYNQNGDVSALPYFVMWLSSVLLGYLSDKVIESQLVTTTKLRRILATVGSVAPGIGIMIASYVTNNTGLVILFVISMAFMGCCYSSLRVNPLDLSRNHTAVVMAIVNGSGAISGFVAPSVVGLFVSDSCAIYSQQISIDEKRKEWQTVFSIVFSVLIVTNIPFMLFGSGDLQEWDTPEDTPGPSDLRRRSTISGGEPIREKYKNYYPEQPAITE